MRLFAIGGGEVRIQSTLEIDKILVEASGKDKPKLLFIPTASGDAEGYVDTIKHHFGDLLGCEVDTLCLLTEGPSLEMITTKINAADIIYVGGGNTKMMLATWHVYGVNTLLKEAYANGTIVSGLSAGSICWFAKGHSDSDTISAGEEKPYSIIEALNLIPMIHCPHYNEDHREEDFRKHMAEIEGVGIGIDNDCALEIKDGTYRILATKKGANAYRVYFNGNKVVQEKISKTRNYQPVARLFQTT